MDKVQPIAEGHSHMIHELKWRGASAALGAVDHDKIRSKTCCEHRLDQGEELPRMPHAQFEADWLVTRKASQFRNELHHPNRRGKGRMPDGRNAILAHGHFAYA